MKVAAAMSDLVLFSRIESATQVSGASLLRVDAPADLPADAADRPGLMLINWTARDACWTCPLRALRDAGARVIRFGPHTTSTPTRPRANRRLGPMWARSRRLTQAAALVTG